MEFHKFLSQDCRRQIISILLRRIPAKILAQSLATSVAKLYSMRDGISEIDDDSLRIMLMLLNEEEKMILALDIIPEMENAIKEAKKFFMYDEVNKIISSVRE
ncbi:MAG: hypothetical protein OWQ54_04290 [Sulfolobaceae archaeon]|nr:hypothetical protein [Sulfolobaceae archaeon]